MSRKFLLAALVAIAVPILLLLPWAWGADSIIWMAYVAAPTFIGIAVGAFIYSRTREGCIGGVLSSVASAIIAWAIFAFVIPVTGIGDAEPAATWAVLLYTLIAGVAGLIFGSGVGQSRPGAR